MVSLLSPFNFFAQNSKCEQKAQIVFKTLLNSIGNNFPSPPQLIFSDMERSVASVSNGNIKMERKALNILCSFPDSEAALAYVLAHELAHHYLNHSWMNNTGLSYASSLGDYLSEKSEGYEQRKLEETQADLFAGFFSQISGFHSLAIAPEVLQELYIQYNLPQNLKGYPSFDERVMIINANLKEIEKLSLIFKVGQLSILRGDFDIAKESFTHILNKKFTSREIYNNLGSLYLKKAIDNFGEDISKYMYPIFFEENTRAEIGTTRNINEILGNPKKELELAIQMFERSVSLDNTFIPAKINLILSEMIKCKINENDCSDLILNKLHNISNVEQKTTIDIQVLSSILFSSSNKSKLKKIVKKGSLISEYNFHIAYNMRNVKIEENIFIEKHNEININELSLFGLKKPYNFVSSGNGLKIKKKQIGEDFIFEVNNLIYYIEINQGTYITSKGLQIGDQITHLKELYGPPDEILKFGEILYFNYKKSKVVFASLNSKIIKIIIYS